MRLAPRGLSRAARRLPPPLALAALYLACILLGAVLLATPWAQTETVPFADALFTSVSAVTVTGLTVVPTGPAFSLFGEAVILVLMQLGGLGLMTFAVLVLSALGINVGLPQRMMLRADLNQTSYAGLGAVVRVILTVALAAEALGALILATVFVPRMGWPDGLWTAVFLSVSAFNNAGFTLSPDSLRAFAGSAPVSLTVSALFIAGGLGFVVLSDLVRARRWAALTLHSKLMLSGTAVLALGGWALFAALEWRNPGTLGALGGTGERLLASWFQAVTPRTAGFSTLDTADMQDATSVLTIALMLVGGGSSSTASGIKVTTLIVMLLATLAFFRRQAEVQVFGRSLRLGEVMKMMALITVSMSLVLVALFVAAITHDGAFLPLLFEIASAFGNVGLSLGATGELDALGRAVIMVLMFLGRVGPLTLGFFLATRSAARVRYPPGQVYLG